jgi:hypothetical protein
MTYPPFISTNVRKLDNKLDELQEITLLNNAKVVGYVGL